MSKVLNVIVVDDEHAVEMLFKAFFESEIENADLKITYFDLATKCLSSLAKNSEVDLILSDINMPEMNGFEFLDELREKYSHVPVYMMSAYGSDDYISKALDKGARGFFVKPFDFDEIKKLVENISQI
ncbi:response regulator [Bacteriovorax sp. Seq25_V]|uniref:response regulator n=1 Tax=Bacteriovorax sp. Seq25_V TaxID=1201288 RepID=UPI000389FAE6|nr:response regulator [Bacteriovorax sp. Seq25_V]EQC46210.1 response regulator receiver domain protein [Bacteriovorax sp. Seq25_V]